MLRHPLGLLSALLAALLVAVASPGYLAAGEPVLLGINYPLTGPYSVEGLDQIRAARMAVDEINGQGGILGRRVVLMTRDSASDVLRTEINVRELIKAGCSMIFGGSSSAVAITAGDICQTHGVPFFGTLTYSTATTLENAHRYTFRECYNSWMAARVMAEWLNSRFQGKRYFYITADYTWGWTTEESVRQATLTTDREGHPGVLTPLGSTDFREALDKAAQAEPDVLVLVLFGKDMAYALRQATETGLKQRCQVVVPNLTLGMAERAGPKVMDGVVGALPWTWKVPYLYGYPRGKAFVEAFVQRYRRYPSTSGASAYTIVHEYKSAVERAGGFQGRDVVLALENHAYRLLKDLQLWRGLDHQSVQTVYMVRGNSVKQVLADPLRLDFFSILETRNGMDLAQTPEQWRRLRRKAGLPESLEPLE